MGALTNQSSFILTNQGPGAGAGASAYISHLPTGWKSALSTEDWRDLTGAELPTWKGAWPQGLLTATLCSQPCCITLELFALSKVSFFAASQIGLLVGLELCRGPWVDICLFIFFTNLRRRCYPKGSLQEWKDRDLSWKPWVWYILALGAVLFNLIYCYTHNSVKWPKSLVEIRSLNTNFRVQFLESCFKSG